MIKCYNHFEDYIQTSDVNNFHPKIDTLIDSLPNDMGNLHNIILYGKPGIGKYTQALRIIKKFSSSDLKYEKRIQVCVPKSEYFIKMSDIHFEVDISLLGCNAKIFWHEIYNQIVDIVSSRPIKSCIIMCKNMHVINSDLLDVMYSYIQRDTFNDRICIRYLFITESVSFLPDTILNTCEIIGIENIPDKTLKKHVKQINKSFTSNDMNNGQYANIKSLYDPSISKTSVQDTIIENICSLLLDDIEKITFSELRDYIYELFIYEVDISICIWEIISRIVKSNKLTETNIEMIMYETYKFLRLFNNNYRPIYHVERYLYVINNIIKT